MKKILGFEKLYSSDDMAGKVSQAATASFDYSEIDSLTLFSGTHPRIMQNRIAQKNWKFEHDISRKKFSLKGKLLHLIEQLTGKRLFDYKNYRKI
jgi:hypothetical protein